MKQSSKFRMAAFAAVLALPVLGAFTPAQIVASTDHQTYGAGKSIVKVLFLSHILAITDVLHNCGGGYQNIICPVLKPKNHSLW